MSTYIISDIHGCNDAFRRALKAIRLKKSDTLILLGDLIGRGQDSKGVLDTVLLLKGSNFNIHCLLGNHEQMMLSSLSDFSKRDSWVKNGGNKVMKSFFTHNFNQIPKKYIDLILSFERYVEIGKYILVHAGLDMRSNNPYDNDSSLLWMREWGECYVPGWLKDRKIIHGHTPINKNEIKNQLLMGEEIICIDNGAYITKEGFGSICVFNLEKQLFHFEPVRK